MIAVPNLGVAGQDLEDLCEETSSASHLKLSKYVGQVDFCPQILHFTKICLRPNEHSILKIQQPLTG